MFSIALPAAFEQSTFVVGGCAKGELGQDPVEARNKWAFGGANVTIKLT